MSEKIFLIQPDASLVTVDESPFESEDIFQKLLADHPDLLAGHQVKPGESRRWLLVSREMSVPDSDQNTGRWSLDHLYLDQDGIPTLVEVKRSSDTRIRREVVGQMLDYAANAVVYWPPNEIQHRFELRCEEKGIDPAIELEEFLVNTGLENAEFWERVKLNLQARKIRMLFVTESMPRELKRIIEFLNEQMDPAEVLGLELRHHSGGGVRVLVPQVVGRTETAASRKGTESKTRQWTRELILQEIESKRGSVIRTHLDALLTEFEGIADRLVYGRGGMYGRCSPVIERQEGDRIAKYALLNLWAPAGSIFIELGYLKDTLFSDPRFSGLFEEQVRKLPGIKISKRTAELQVDEANVEARLMAVKEFLVWAVDAARKAPWGSESNLASVDG